MRKRRPVKIIASLTKPESFNTLLISEVSSNRRQAYNNPVLLKRFIKATVADANTISSQITLRGCPGVTGLSNGIDTNALTRATEKLRTLQTSITLSGS